MITNDAVFADRIRVLHTHGGRSKYEYEVIGMNSRLDALQAAILRVKLGHLDSWSEGRQRQAEQYSRWFQSRGLDRVIKLPKVQSKCNHIYNQYVIRVPRRDELKAYLRDCGVPTEIYYPSPLHLQRAFHYLGYKPGDLPQSEAASRDVLSIPVFPEMSVEQQTLVVESIVAFYSH